MRIGIDAHYLGARVLGRETYLGNLIRCLAALPSEHRYVLYLSATGAAEAPVAGFGPGVELRVLPSRGTIVQRTLLLPRALRGDGIDLIYLHTLGVPFYRGRTVLAVHGLHELRYSAPEQRLLQGVLLPWSLSSATRVIANSEYTRNEIVSGYGVPAERVRVVYGGVDPGVFHPGEPSAAAALGAPGDYVLYLGAIEPRKNLGRLITAFARARDRLGPGCSLRIAGIPRGRDGRRHEQELRALTASLGVAGDVRWLGYVTPGEAAALLRGARVFAFPTLHESFGLPPLEAMACGTPALVSRVGALPEVLEEAPLWCNPLDVEGITEGIVRLAEDTSLRAARIAAGRRRAARFTWEEAAARTLEVFGEAAADPRAPAAPRSAAR